MAGQRIPGPVGSDSYRPVIDAGTTPITQTPEPGTIGITGTTTATSGLVSAATIDVEKIIAHLDQNAHQTSQGKCAKYVRQAIEAGGVTIANRPLYAKDYGPALTALGFKKISAEQYSPKKGDVVVLQPPQGRTAGHIEIYNGTTWVSDFVQGTDIYPGAAYRKEKVDYEIFRP